MAIDSDWSSVVLAMHMDGTNGSTSFIDLRGHTMTAVGNAQISTAQSKFGGASALFDGTGDAVHTPDSTDWAFGSGDFTIEAQVRPTDFVSARTIAAQRLSTITTDFWGFRADITTGKVAFFAVVASVLVIHRTTTTALNAATWAHVAAVRSAGVLKIYIDGVEGGTTGADSTISLADTAAPLFIGAAYETYANPFKGYIDDVRITKGVARYIANFTAPTAAFDEGTPPYAGLSAPMPTLEFYGGGSVAVSPPAPTLVSVGGSAALLTAPSPTVYATAHISTKGAALTAPAPTLEAWGGANAKLTAPTPTLSSTATGVIWGTAGVSAPSPEVSAQGVGAIMGRAALAAPSPNARAYSGAVVSITIGAPTVTATGTAGAVGHAAVTVPMFQLSAFGTEQNHGSANLVVPMPRMAASIQAYMTAPMATLTAIGTATITATYEAYALNLNHNSDASDEMTRYTNFPFTHVVRYKNSYYGANSTGLYLLEGTTDDGVAIDWSFKTGMTDFDSPQNKTVTYAYFGGRLGPAATVSIYPSEPAGTSYAYTTPRGQTAQNYRQQFGKGLKARYFAIGAAGSDTLELDSIDLSVVTLKRRI